MIGEAQVAGFLAGFVRVGAWTLAAPVIGQGLAPPRVRVLFAGAVALLLAPLHPAATFDNLLSLLPFELFFGLTVGAAARFILAGAESGGQILGMQMGLGFAATFDPIAHESSITTRRLTFAMAALAFILVGGFDAAIRALALPIDARALTEAPLRGLIQLTEHVLLAAVRIAAPLLLAGFVANVTMALVSKAAPALNVFSVMLALFLAVGLFILSSSSPAFVRDMHQVGTHARDVVWEVVR